MIKGHVFAINNQVDKGRENDITGGHGQTVAHGRGGRVEGMHGGCWEDFCDRYGDWGRDLALWAGRKYGGLSLREAGEKAGGLDYVTVSVAVRRLERRAVKDGAIQSALASMERKCKCKDVTPNPMTPNPTRPAGGCEPAAFSAES